MTTVTTEDIQKNLNDYLRKIAKGPIIVTRGGKPVAVLGAPDEETLYEWRLLNSPRFLAVLAEGRRQVEAGEVVSHEAFWKNLKARRALKRKTKKQKPAAAR
jgi:PHD/YefM family antitoxin component YafN of YafNO toxin-antitoxin module